MDYVITAGDVSSGLSIGTDDSMLVEDGGTAVDTTAENTVIENDGTTSGTTLYAAEEINSGVADGTTVYSGGDISTYGDISGTVASGGHVTIYSGGNAYDTILSGAGAREVVLAEDGTVSITTTITNGGTVQAIDGAAIDGTLIVMSGGSALVHGGGTTTSDDVNGGIEATAGNTVSATVENGGLLFEEGSGVATGAAVSSGGTLYIDGPAVVGSDTNVGPGGVLEDGGTTTGTLLSGLTEQNPYTAEEIVERDSVASGTLIYSGGFEEIASGGMAVSAQVQEFGVLVVSAGGSAVDITMNGGVYDPGNGLISVSGVTTSTTLLGHATEFVDEGGVASHTVVSSGAQELVSGGTISGSIFTYAGRAMVGGTTAGNGSAVSVTMSSGSELAVQAGGFASYTNISLGGRETVNTGGSTESSTVNAGGVEYIIAGGSVADLVMKLGGAIDLADLPTVSGGSATVTAPGVLTVTEGATTSTVQLSPNAPGGQTAATYSVGKDSGGGTLVTLTSVPCFARGTAILTGEGERAVEALRIGDRVVTAAGVMRPVVWIGHRRLDCRGHVQPDLVLPVRIHVGAIADGMPSRDLLLSPDHSLLIDGVLIPAKHLINGRSIAQENATLVEYWHVELDRHDILLAEGLAVESYLDTGNRNDFAEGIVHADLAEQTWDNAYAELVQDGPRLIAVKRKLFDRALAAPARPIPELRVFAGRQELAPEVLAGDCLAYRIPPAIRTVQLVSPAWVPSSCEAASLDRRRLGVRLFEISVDGVALDLSDPAFASGFHPAEWTVEGRCRWTNGTARLALPADAEFLVLRVGDNVRTPWQGDRPTRDEHKQHEVAARASTSPPDHVHRGALAALAAPR